MQKSKKNTIQLVAIIVLSLLLVLAIALGASGAWFRDSDEGKATATLGDPVTIALYQGANAFTGETAVSLDDVLPGAAVIGVITVQAPANTSECWVRAKIVVDGAELTTADMAEIMTAVDPGEGWSATPDGEGWYYCTSRLAANGTTAPLTDAVTIPTAWGDAEADYGDGNHFYGKTITITVTAEAVQTANLEATECAAAFTEVNA